MGEENEDWTRWVTINVDGTRYFGRLEPYNHDEIGFAELIRDTLQAIRSGEGICLFHCFEYPIFGEQGPDGRGFRKIPVPTNVDMLTRDVPIHFWNISRIYFWGNLHKEDLKMMAQMVISVRETMSKTRLVSVAGPGDIAKIGKK